VRRIALKVLSATDVDEWFSQSPNRDDERIHRDGQDLFFAHPEASCIDLEYPPKLERLPFFAGYLAQLGYEAKDFQGALLWFTNWGVWNSLDEGIGYRIIEKMHDAAGQPKSFEAAPGHVFRADELQEAVGMLLQPMVFGWDAMFVPWWSYGYNEFFLHVSHDSFVSVVTRTKEFHVKTFDRLRELDLNPKTGHEMRLRRFCRVP
jgi:hypothetical protein